MTVREMLGKLDSREITEWMAYWKVKADDAKRDRERQEMMTRVKGRRVRG